MPPNKKNRSSQFDDLLTRFAKSLLYEATGGSIGSPPPTRKTVADPKIDPTFQEKRALLDSLIKLRILDEKYKQPDDGDNGLQEMRRRLNGGTSGENFGRGINSIPSESGEIPDAGNA